MAVVINDFEVVAEEAPPAAESAASPGTLSEEGAPTPQELELVNRRQRERAMRVYAD
jgi:hypothetical protein